MKTLAIHVFLALFITASASAGTFIDVVTSSDSIEMEAFALFQLFGRLVRYDIALAGDVESPEKVILTSSVMWTTEIVAEGDMASFSQDGDTVKLVADSNLLGLENTMVMPFTYWDGKAFQFRDGSMKLDGKTLFAGTYALSYGQGNITGHAAAAPAKARRVAVAWGEMKKSY